MGRVFLLITIIILLSLQVTAQSTDQTYNCEIVRNITDTVRMVNKSIIGKIEDVDKSIRKDLVVVHQDITRISERIEQIQRQIQELNKAMGDTQRQIAGMGDVTNLQSGVVLLLYLVLAISVLNSFLLFLLLRRRSAEIC